MTWLHLSDLHFGAPEVDRHQPHIRAKLWEELAAPPHEGLTGPDLVLVTGDLTFEGRPEQFRAAAAFFEDLQKRVEEGSGRKPVFFVVPGNHDLEWPSGREMTAFHWL